MHIIAISGTNASGKDTLADMLAKDYNYLVISLSDILRDEVKRRGLPVERSVLREVGFDMKRTLGPGAGTNSALKTYEQASKQYAGLIICSLRSMDEAARVRELGGAVVWVDADQRLRYERIISRQRSAEDNKTFEQFATEEAAEMHPPTDNNPFAMNMAAIKAGADLVIHNDGDDVEAFKAHAVKLLSLA